MVERAATAGSVARFAKEEIEKAIAYSVKKIDYEELRQELRKLHVRLIGALKRH